MGQITSSIGLVSGLDTAGIIDQLMQIEGRSRDRIEAENAEANERQTLFNEISAKLLSLKLNTSRLTQGQSFEQTTATSSDEAVATITSGPGAATGSYDLTVKRMVSGQQSISGGFRSADVPLETDGIMTFNRGGARLDRETRLDQLNGGRGIDRGSIRITAKNQESAVIDLSDALTLEDVVAQINNADVAVRARVEEGSLVITDASGVRGSSANRRLEISDVGNSETATSLGIADSVRGNELYGLDLNTIGRDTLLSDLNDGLGVRVGRGEAAGFNISTSDGRTFNIDLTDAVTLGDVVTAIGETTEGAVAVGVAENGRALEMFDRTGETGFTITAASGEPADTSNVLRDLGLTGPTEGGVVEGTALITDLNSKSVKQLFGGRGLAGLGGDPYQPVTGETRIADLFGGTGLTTSAVAAGGVSGATEPDELDDLRIFAKDSALEPYGVDLDGLETVAELQDAVSLATGGRVQLRIEDDRIFAVDTTDEDARLTIEDVNASEVAAQLGIGAQTSRDLVAGRRLDPVPALDEETGLPLAGTSIVVTDTDGGEATLDFEGAESVDDLLEVFNQSGLSIEAELSPSGTGIQVRDTGRGFDTFTIRDDEGSNIATQLGLAGTFYDGSAEGRDLGFAFVNEGTTLESLGVSAGEFELTDSAGRTARVNVPDGSNAMGDIIRGINGSGIGIAARINDDGTGLLLEDTADGTQPIEIEDIGGTTAADLNLFGGGAPGQAVDGSLRGYVRVEAADTLRELAQRIDASDVPVEAAIINDGSPGRPARMSFSSRGTGAGAAFTVDSGAVGISANRITEARDALVFIGGDNPEDALMVTSGANQVADIIDGATVTLNAVSDDPVSVTVAENPQAITDEVTGFVEGFNELITRLDELDSYNAETDEAGLLLGDATVSQVRRTLYDAVIGRNNGLTGRFKSLSEIGVTVGSGAALEVDTAKLQAAISEDKESVRELFTFEQFAEDPVTGEPTEELIAQGIGQEIDKLIERLTDVETGVVQQRIDTLDRQILSNNRRIDAVDARLEAKRAQLENEFAQLESVLAGLQDQSGALNQLSVAAGNPAPAQ